jgi:GNAT superfamily N-acetyltransferase
MSLSLRLARVSDAAEIARLTGHLGYDVDASIAEARLGRILLRQDQRFWVAELDGRPVGWLHATIDELVDSGAFVHISGLVVDKSHRRRGVGACLLEQAERWARDGGYPMVRLHSSASRIATHRFYEGRGYTNIKTQYSFVKPFDSSGPESLHRLVPRVDQQG